MTVFDFSDFREFIRFRLSQQLFTGTGRKKSNLSKVAKDLGYTSPALLCMVLKGKRLPSDEFCEALSGKWDLSVKEREYFRLLVLLERRKRQGGDTAEICDRLRRVAGKRATYVFKELELSRIREWHYLAIKHLVELPKFREDPTWISKALRRKVTPAQADQALKELEAAGILVRDPNSGRLRPAVLHSESSHDIPSAAIRLHQKGMIHRALEALEERPVEERMFSTVTLSLKSSRLPELRKRLVEFVRGFDAEFATGEADSPDTVCQMNLQFFEHMDRGAVVTTSEIVKFDTKKKGTQ